MATSQFSKVDEYGFERPKSFNHLEYERFMSKYLKVLARRSKKWSSFLKNKTFYKSRKFKRYIRKGIPSEHREKIWLLTSGAVKAKEKHGPGLYHELLLETPDELLVEIIRTDLPRTFPENIFFNGTNEYQERLFRILLAYGIHNKRIGYCQGMNYIAGTLLLVTKSEDSSFWLLKMLIEEILPDYYSPTMAGLITDIDAVAEIIRERYSDVFTHFINLGLPWPVVITKWFVCLFCEVLPIETVLRVWDCLFNEGSKILFRVALTLVNKHYLEFLASQQFTELAEFIKGFTKNNFALECHTFMENVFKLTHNITDKRLDMLRKEISEKKIDQKMSVKIEGVAQL